MLPYVGIILNLKSGQFILGDVEHITTEIKLKDDIGEIETLGTKVRIQSNFKGPKCNHTNFISIFGKKYGVGLKMEIPDLMNHM